DHSLHADLSWEEFFACSACLKLLMCCRLKGCLSFMKYVKALILGVEKSSSRLSKFQFYSDAS
ncbi:hypothetical protein PJO47_29515, partial [Mycobacterium kansasii]